ncbi:hypothetical protein D3C73_1454250 [compost metagenome]
MRAVPGLLRRQCQAVGQQHGVGRLVEPTTQCRVVIETVLLAQRMVDVTGDAQDLHQLTLLHEQQLVTLLNPVRQVPGFHQCASDTQQANAEQLFLDFTCRLALVDNPQFPLFEQLRVGQRQRP